MNNYLIGIYLKKNLKKILKNVFPNEYNFETKNSITK